MKNVKILYPSLLLALTFAFSSCSDDDASDQDLNKPVISEVEVENEEQNGENHGEKVHTGEQAKVHFMLSDDKGLSSWKIDIHDAFDGHSHGKVAAPYTAILSGTASGTMSEIEVDLGVIPTDATAGEYHCIVNATDAAGNSADFRDVVFVLSNGSEPQLNILSPGLDSIVHMDKGSSFNLTGSLTDDTGIKTFEIFVSPDAHEDHNHGKVADEDFLLFDKDDFADGVTNFDLAECGTLTLVNEIPDGSYVIKFISTDMDGNTMVEKFEVHID